jgi:hypothetical protein
MRSLVFVLAMAICVTAYLDVINTIAKEDLTKEVWKGKFKDGTKITKADLSRILREHKKWIQSSESRGQKADLSGADLIGTNLLKANLSRASLHKTHISEANLSETNLTGAHLDDATISGTNFSGANLSSASLNQARLVNCSFSGVNLSGCSIYGISVSALNLSEAKQSDLIISDDNESIIAVDDFELAQFISLILNHNNIREIINTISSRVVLILGQFTP